jgi:hypothetical protein
MNRLLRAGCIVLAVLSMGAFVSVGGPLTALRPPPDGAGTVSLHVGLSFSPWLSYERNAHYIDGSVHDGVRFHPLSWSWLLLVVAIELILLSESRRRSEAGVAEAGAAPNRSGV